MLKFFSLLALVPVFLSSSSVAAQNNESKVTFSSYVSRAGWNARIPEGVVFRFRGAAPYVVYGSCLEQPSCTDDDECIEAVQNIQLEHQIERRLNDVAWSFLVGGNNKVYLGRGFNVEGQHTAGYNDKSIGFCFIGPDQTPEMLQAAADIIQLGITNGNIAKDYEFILTFNN